VEILHEFVGQVSHFSAVLFQLWLCTCVAVAGLLGKVCTMKGSETLATLVALNGVYFRVGVLPALAGSCAAWVSILSIGVGLIIDRIKSIAGFSNLGCTNARVWKLVAREKSQLLSQNRVIENPLILSESSLENRLDG